MAKFTPNPHKTYIAFNKPYAVLCQFSIPEGSTKKTLAEFGFPKNVYSVGRLDFDSEGLLVLTDDGRLNSELLLGKNAHERTYYVCIENIPLPEQIQKLKTGVVIEGKKTFPAKAEFLNEEPAFPPRPVPIRSRKHIPTAWIKLTLIEGRNRQVRKMTAAVGCPTLRLVRISIGKLSLFDLKLSPGDWRVLTKEELFLLCDR